jgi:hypothetical protein
VAWNEKMEMILGFWKIVFQIVALSPKNEASKKQKTKKLENVFFQPTWFP